jgi:cytochrome c biogenesis protein CcmG, thiol:disulfide interchange protein DsbE
MPRLTRPARRLAILVVALGLVAALVLSVVLTGGAPSTGAPTFSLPRLGGGAPVAYPLRGTDRHRPVVVSFFASWCPPCRTELPVVAQVANGARRAGDRVVFLGVDGNDNPSSGLAFARHSGVTFAVGSDAESLLAPRFGFNGYPDTAFIDASGKVAGSVRGPVSRATLGAWVARLSSTA